MDKQQPDPYFEKDIPYICQALDKGINIIKKVQEDTMGNFANVGEALDGM